MIEEFYAPGASGVSFCAEQHDTFQGCWMQQPVTGQAGSVAE
jgi:hypothetical protein